MIPACAPSTPASHEPSVLTTSPFSYSLVSSPRYQRFPDASWAYQSRVSSTVWPSSRDEVVHHGRRDAEDLLRVLGDGHLDLLLGSIGVGFAVDPAAPRRHRPVRVVERDPGEQGRIERDRVGALRQRDRRRRGTGRRCARRRSGDGREWGSRYRWLTRVRCAAGTEHGDRRHDKKPWEPERPSEHGAPPLGEPTPRLLSMRQVMRRGFQQPNSALTDDCPALLPSKRT